MNVILKEDVASLGKAGDTLKVSDGYARNFLIPRGLALEANIGPPAGSITLSPKSPPQ